MKPKLALIALAGLVVAAGSLSASEAIWQVLVNTDLRPSTFVLADSLPEVGCVAAPFGEPVPAPAPSLSVPLTIPFYRPVARSGKALFDANLIVMVGLNIADYLSTRQALKYPGLTEINPLMKPFVKSPAAFAAFKFGTTSLSYWSFKAIFKKNKTLAWVMTTASNTLLSYVVAHNMRLVQGARAR